MIRLGVNIDHIATLRQARGTDYPDPVEGALFCVEAGAGGITAHLREDRRHIQEKDVVEIARRIDVPFNLEMANTPEGVAFALELTPEEVCLVPEKRQELTTEGGLDVVQGEAELRPVIKQLNDIGVEVSLFVDPTIEHIQLSADMGAPTIELHTGRYCEHAEPEELARLIHAAEVGHQLGLKINAGHGIHLGNIEDILRIPHLDTLNIGHSIVSEAIFYGIKEATVRMLNAMARGAPSS